MALATALSAALHGGLAGWFSLPKPVRPAPWDPPLRVSLQATIAETSANTARGASESPPPVAMKPRDEPVEPRTERIKADERSPRPEAVEARTARLEPPADRLDTEPLAEIPPRPPAEPVGPAPVDAVATARYEQLLVAWLERYKKYPSRARRMRIEGEVRLRIVIDRSGRMLQVGLAQASGSRLLDKTALAMARRANPFPPMPEHDARERMEFVVPVAFVLR